MKTITKTFYTDYKNLCDLRKNGNTKDFMGKCSFEKTNYYDQEIQISWQEPEKKIEITESEFDEVVYSFFKLDENNNSPIASGIKMQTYLKQKFFGAEKMNNETQIIDLGIALEKIQQLKQQLESCQKELDQQRFNNKHNLSIDQKVSDRIKSLEQQLKEAVEVIELMKTNMKYIEPEYDEIDIKVNAFLAKYRGEK